MEKFVLWNYSKTDSGGREAPTLDFLIGRNGKEEGRGRFEMDAISRRN